ncbi:hypothetical protein [Falsirhodobacter halotolerans]|uniref:hypothetical protein n=1 Tax=Falsirhodobacter halotolerans TaxID=1146892 RepID=UPI001FD142F7|nr:hypothetical protein [Falsirhodobacter halotolerans]MCJ8138578.1 hypothetical protein [Falsirhodobacter halotolerans]
MSPVPATQSTLADELVLLNLASGVKGQPETMDALQNDLLALGTALEAKMYLFEGLTEAVINSIEHAYVDTAARSGDMRDGNTVSTYPTAGSRWWATSCYDPVSKSLRFFVYDQGVGIAATLDREEGWRRRISEMIVKLGSSPSKSDAQDIEAAFEIGRTRTGLDERGKGLDQMRDVVRSARGGYMRVLSGKGDVELTETECRKFYLPSHTGGTLIEWNLPYASFARD